MASFQASTKKIGLCGGFTGVPIDMNVDGITRIVKISIRHGAAIDALTVYFLRNGHEESTWLWGGQGGNLTEFELQPTEYITSVKGYVGQMWGYFVVRSMTFETNLKTYGPFGEEDGIPFELPAINGQIIGFYGRCGQLVDAIGVYVKVNSTTNVTGGCGKTCSCGSICTGGTGNTGGSTGTDGIGTTGGSTGTGGTGNAGGSTGTGTTGTWTESTEDFWDRPVSGA